MNHERVDMTSKEAVMVGLEGIIPSGALAVRLVTGASWSEGPVWLPESRRLRWSDIPGNRILEVDPLIGELIVHRTDVEFTNGRTLARDGAVIQCSHGRRAIEREVDGQWEILVDRFNGRRLNSPNDVVVKSDGTIWFTDPPYGIVQAHEGHLGDPEYGGNFVFRFDPTSLEMTAVVTDMDEPNGLAFSPDELILYVSDTSAALRPSGEGFHHIRAYDVVDGDSCLNGRVFAVIEPGLPDGFRIDAQGRLWSSSADSVQVFSTTGALVGKIPIPEKVGNLCFGGPNGADLFIAATTSIYSIPTLTTGATR
jgi:gluconolactonase